MDIRFARRQVRGLHAQQRPDFGGARRQRLYERFGRAAAVVIAACDAKALPGYALVQYIDRPESAYPLAQRFSHVEDPGVDAVRASSCRARCRAS